MSQNTTKEATTKPVSVEPTSMATVKRRLANCGLDAEKVVREVIFAYETEQVDKMADIGFTPMQIKIDREYVLNVAKECVCKNRQDQYGPPEDSFKTIAAMWEAYLKVAISAHDVAAMMVLLKVARVKNSAKNADNWIDIAGYGACGGEIAGQLSD